ncbi:hypothetical protein IWQ60_000595 [Tieghemiomyces parasiticus]|uniref:Zinc finger CHCC-type domain-containing protein n=1 Tax=Tieghemiomyces parasiticus TaxID=78921 RepID=A0A9W8AFT2_9FUNG|nr:hypothetical protein IWQ60_000595 [Tieghemiomyces parasiticus]
MLRNLRLTSLTARPLSVARRLPTAASIHRRFLSSHPKQSDTVSIEEGKVVVHESTKPITITDPQTASIEAAKQSPNHPTTWSHQQRPRAVAMDDPRFAQVDLLAQPRPMAAIDLIAEEPIRVVDGRKAVCDGGGGPLGHPKVYINLDQEDIPHACGYCGLRFQKAPHHH